MNEQNEAKPADVISNEAGAGQGQQVTLTMAELQGLIAKASEEAVARAMAAMPANGAGAAPEQRLMRNRDFEVQNTGEGFQTQEDATTLALTLGPVSHGRGFIPAPPEAVAARDLAEHAPLINRLKGMGYEVSLNRVEFDAAYLPKDDKGVLVADRPEPKDARPLIEKLRNTDARFSRIWIQNWLKGKILTGDRQIDTFAQKEAHTQRISALQKVEGGDFSGLDNVEVDMGSDIGARSVESVTI